MGIDESVFTDHSPHIRMASLGGIPRFTRIERLFFWSRWRVGRGKQNWKQTGFFARRFCRQIAC